MAGTLPMLLGKFTLTTAGGTAAVTVGGTAVNITAGDYYTAGGGSTHLAETLQTGIRAIGASQNTSTVALTATSTAAPRIVITLKTAATLTFNATFATICGFTAYPYSSAASFTGEQQPRYIWSPTRPPSYTPGNTPPLWMPRSSTIYGRSADGTTWSVARPTVYDAGVEFTDLPAADVITPTTGTVYRDLQQWFVDVVAAGMPFRYVYDRTDYAAASDYYEAIWYDDGAEEVGGLMEALGRRVRSYLGLFSVKLPLAKKI